MIFICSLAINQLSTAIKMISDCVINC